MLYTLKRLTIILAVIVGMAVMFASSAFAHTDTNSMALRGQCGGQIHSWQQYVNNLSFFGGAVQQAAKVNQTAGYVPRDGSFTQWLKDRVVFTHLAAPATIKNYGCNASGIFKAGNKSLPKGWPVLVALPGKYSKSDVRMAPAKGYKPIKVHVHLVAQASCTNPGENVVVIIIYVKVTPPVKKPKPTPKPPVKPTVPPGSCNITITGGTVNGDINNCSTVSITVVCSNINVTKTFTGATAEDVEAQAYNWQHDNCNTPPAVPCNCTPPPVVVPPPVIVVPPPSKSAHVIESITVLNDVRVGDTSPTWCATVKLDNSDSGTIKFAPVYGRFTAMSGYGGTVNSDGSITFSVTGGETTKCATYNSPTEVPPGGQDDVVVTLATGLGTVQGTPSSSPPSPWFRIDPKPVNP